MKVSMRFTGGAELARNLAALPPRVQGKVAREVLLDAAEPMRRDMSVQAPRSDEAPHIADNIVTMLANQGREDAQMNTVAVGPRRGFAYGLPLEFGTIYHPAQPFARPAFDRTAPKSLEMLRAGLWREIAARGGMHVISAPTSVQGEV